MKRNRFFCIMPILLLALSLSARAAYSDVPADEWYAGAVDYCAANALMQGVGDGRFAPQETVTRATVLTVLHRLSGSPAASKRGAFSDVPANEWYAEAADWAAETGLAYGVGDGRLAPGDTVARQDLAVFLWRLKGSPKAAEPAGFPDEADVYGYALDAVRWASAEGIVVGTGDGSFAPHGSATRAQLATILMRVHRAAADSVGMLRAPCGIASDGTGALLVADGYTKRVWTVRGGSITAFAGADSAPNSLGAPGGGYRDGTLSDSLFAEPWAITPFLDGWAVSDAANNALRLISGGRVQTINGTAGGTDMVYDRPTGLATDDEGCLYVADTGSGTIRRITRDGRAAVYARGLNEPTGLCWYGGSLYVAETGENRVLRISDGIVKVLAGTGEEGFIDGDARQAAFRSPIGVAAGEDGTIYVADMVNGAVRAISDGKVRTLLSPDDDLSSPMGLLVQDGVLWVSDHYTGRLFDLSI